MAESLNAETYGTVEDVERMVGDLARGGQFRNGFAGTEALTYADAYAGTNPSLDEVIRALNRGANMLNARLASYGYVVPVAVSNTNVHGWAQEVNAALASARLLNAQPTRELDVGTGGEVTASSRAESFYSQVRDFLDAAANGELIAEKLSDAPSRRNTSSPALREPIFTLGMMSEV